MLDSDRGEQMSLAHERATGSRLWGCPWRAARDPFVAAVMQAHRWRKDGELSTRLGRAMPEALARGLEVYGGALDAIGAFDTKQAREEAEAKRRADQNPQAPPPIGGGGRRRRR